LEKKGLTALENLHIIITRWNCTIFHSNRLIYDFTPHKHPRKKFGVESVSYTRFMGNRNFQMSLKLGFHYRCGQKLDFTPVDRHRVLQFEWLMARWIGLYIENLLVKAKISQHSAFMRHEFFSKIHFHFRVCLEKKRVNCTSKFQTHPKHVNHSGMPIFALVCCFYVSFTSYNQKLGSDSSSSAKPRFFNFLSFTTVTGIIDYQTWRQNMANTPNKVHFWIDPIECDF